MKVSMFKLGSMIHTTKFSLCAACTVQWETFAGAKKFLLFLFCTKWNFLTILYGMEVGDNEVVMTSLYIYLRCICACMHLMAPNPVKYSEWILMHLAIVCIVCDDPFHHCTGFIYPLPFVAGLYMSLMIIYQVCTLIIRVQYMDKDNTVASLGSF